MRTDALGFFCVRLEPTASVEGDDLRYDGDRFHTATSAKVPSETGKRRVALDFESGAMVASLDSPSFAVWVATRDLTGAGSGDPIRLVLSVRPTPESNEETELAVTDVQVGSTARFDVETRLLGAPGPGKLVVRFEGTSVLAPAVESALLMRRTAAR